MGQSIWSPLPWNECGIDFKALGPKKTTRAIGTTEWSSGDTKVDELLNTKGMPSYRFPNCEKLLISFTTKIRLGHYERTCEKIFVRELRNIPKRIQLFT